MAATVAHEINNPLEAVGNLIYLLRTNHPDEKTRAKYLELAEAELSRVSSIARRTLGFYRDVSKPGEVLLSEIVDAVLELYQQKLTAEGITIRKKISSEVPIVARRDEVRQIVDNLVANALDAIPKESGLVELMIEAAAGQVTLEIKDNGSGIESRNLGQIFEPFFTTKKELGTGLGLWVARELTGKNGGSIAVSSTTEPGKQGTAFTLVFPAAQPKLAQRTAERSA
jgi:signal transduction histidine kinase